GASRAFAVADHQVAHVYVQDQAIVEQVRDALLSCDGIETVWGKAEQAERQLAHARSGELLAITERDRWFSYYFWLDDKLAPDYARTVDIHKKPGYDPVELFLDPKLSLGKLSVGAKLLRRKLGFRGLLDVISLDDTLVKGSHGRPTDDPHAGPLLLSSEPHLVQQWGPQLLATDVMGLLLAHVLDD
ncbi:MAG TPA: alkaline phosphatase family protein, partial [Polyangiaceae bacterium]|nr:alkaline phosphatase family protein [Polyangiaceae bacterium]